MVIVKSSSHALTALKSFTKQVKIQRLPWEWWWWGVSLAEVGQGGALNMIKVIQSVVSLHPSGEPCSGWARGGLCCLIPWPQPHPHSTLAPED